MQARLNLYRGSFGSYGTARRLQWLVMTMVLFISGHAAPAYSASKTLLVLGDNDVRAGLIAMLEVRDPVGLSQFEAQTVGDISAIAKHTTARVGVCSAANSDQWLAGWIHSLQVFSRIGLVPDLGSTWLLPRLVGPSRALDLTLTSRSKDASGTAVPMCGVMGDTQLFDYFAAAQVTAQALAGEARHAVTDWAAIQGKVTSALFTTFPSAPTATGRAYLSVIQNLTGGPRPLFDLGVAVGGSFAPVWGVFGSDGSVNGILNRNVTDTNRFTYRIDGDAAASSALNAAAQKRTAAPDANRLRRDGLRWIPVSPGDIGIPVVTLHTLGDLYVPFSMQQIYQRRVADKGKDRWLVQRAIRGASHCDFTVAEQVEAFDAMVQWEQGGAKPGGDDVQTAATVAAPTYGCRYTRNTLGPDDSTTTRQLRAVISQNAASCP